MEWQISFLDEAQVVVIETSGPLEQAQSLEMARAGLAAARQRRWRRALIDHRGLSAFSLSTIGIYDRPDQLRQLGFGPDLRIAEIVPEAYAQDFAFLETVSANRGLHIKIFLDQELALSWLKEG